ncbi:hypothetical protein H6P81_015514 [Aristolochia fimbriata]|uniref:Uncharacterized protein n=1 Tax=Aristolochia fimbriata TaxID=158543 RepID=A0AAV7E7L7_ARIFI|nr:hypothetical protein H6P81_015514 [Aristolochia fimbriata]
MEDIRVQEDAIVSTLYHNVRLLARANRAGCALLKILDQGFNFIPRTTLNSPPPTIRLKLPALLLSNTCLRCWTISISPTHRS